MAALVKARLGRAWGGPNWGGGLGALGIQMGHGASLTLTLTLTLVLTLIVLTLTLTLTLTVTSWRVFARVPSCYGTRFFKHRSNPNPNPDPHPNPNPNRIRFPEDTFLKTRYIIPTSILGHIRRQ